MSKQESHKRDLKLFIGSSGESTLVVQAIHANLREFSVVPWPHAFGIGESYSQSLLNQMKSADFAIFVVSGDDRTESRGKTHASPRDNVIFELGLFIGRLGFDRCFAVVERGDTDPKIPSDLAGVVFETYRPSDDYNELLTSLGPACYAIRAAISKIGQHQTPSERLASGLQGFWYEKINPPIHKSAIGVIEFTKLLDGIKLHGSAFDAEGRLVARWESTASNVPNERKLLYSWQGIYEADPSERFDGSGEMVFQLDDDGEPLHGRSDFSESRMRAEEPNHRHTGRAVRCSDTDVAVLRGEDDDAIAQLLKGRLAPAEKKNPTAS